MPALVNSSVGSFDGTSELDGTTTWRLLFQNSRKAVRTSAAFMPAKASTHRAWRGCRRSSQAPDGARPANAGSVDVAHRRDSAEVAVAGAVHVLGGLVAVSRVALRAGALERVADGLDAERGPREDV